MNSASLDPLRTHLPQGVLLEVAEVADHMADLHPEERAPIAQAVEIRQREYSSARHLAHGLLQRLGVESDPLLIGKDRSPVWPEAVLGSLSHSRDWCAVTVAHAREGLLGIGVDIEDIRPMAAPLFAEILTPRELQDLPEDDTERTAQALAIFSIKESVYKCLQPIGNTGMGFQAMQLDFSEDPTRPRLDPLEGLRSRLPAGYLPRVHLLRHNDTLLSLAILETPQTSSA